MNILLACLLWFYFAFTSLADDDIAIAAIVNDMVISTHDLEQRVALALGTTGRPDTPQMRAEARPQLLQSLINEALQLQEAKRYNILVSAADIRNAIEAIEQKQNKPPGSLRQFIEQKGLSFTSFEQQIKSEVAWRKLLARKVRRNITITDEEIDRARKRIARGRTIREVQIAAVVLPAQEGLSSEELLGIARDIRSLLRNGADAPALLARYSDRLKLDFAPVTWVDRNNLNPVIREAISKLEPGDIAEPVPTPAGFQIIRLLDSRSRSTMPDQNAEVAMKQIILELSDRSSDSEIDSKMVIAREIARHPGSCTEAGIAGLKEFEGLNIEVNYFRTTLAAISPEIRSLIEPLPVTGITKPFASNDGIHLLMLCERISVPMPLPDKEQVRSKLFEDKLQLEAAKYLRTLRREGFIDIRL